jgi:hypothetical protein
MNCIFVLAGNCRTFVDCIDSIYERVILKMFDVHKTNIYIYLYLKLTDPGPKGQEGWNFTYKDNDKDIIINKIIKLSEEYKIQIDYKLLYTNEIADEELLSQIKDRTKYIEYFNIGNLMMRAIHCHYNFEKCGEFIEEKERKENIKFDYIIYVRPDLYFTEDCKPIHEYDANVVTAALEPMLNNDLLAIIPRNCFENFFYDRIKVYRNNTTTFYTKAEDIYFSTINYKIDYVGKYFIKRE